jgi:hypothetical protein
MTERKAAATTRAEVRARAKALSFLVVVYRGLKPAAPPERQRQRQKQKQKQRQKQRQRQKQEQVQVQEQEQQQIPFGNDRKKGSCNDKSKNKQLQQPMRGSLRCGAEARLRSRGRGYGWYVGKQVPPLLTPSGKMLGGDSGFWPVG